VVCGGVVRAPQKDDERRMRAYLYRTANSIIIDDWRRRKRETAWSLKMPFPVGPSSPREIDDDVKNAFAELNAQQRSLLWLAYVEGRDHREIAVAVGVKEKSVRVLLFRARRALAGLLERAGIGPEAA
jgi:RNA polymerase sigma-70 factor (ECF subfamily)